jgi:hemerythrin
MELLAEATVGVPEMDIDHSIQLELLQEVERAVAALNRTSALTIMTRLGDYSSAHFASEQILMRLHAYPRYAEHEAEHGRLLAELQRMQQRLAFDDRADLAAALKALRTWVVVHIQTADREFAQHMRNESAASHRQRDDSPQSREGSQREQRAE